MNGSVLITGGAGFIGSHLAAACRARGMGVRVLDDLSSGREENLAGLDVEFRCGTILSPTDLAGAMRGVDTVFHLAAFVSVAASMEQPEACAELNTMGTLRVLRAAEEAGVGRLVFASSAAVYGENPVTPKREDLPPDPRSPYALTKLDGEFYCGLFHRRGRLTTACARFFNVFGPRQDPASAYAAAIPRFIVRALAGEDLVIYGDGSQTRDFVAASDIASGLLHLAARRELAGPFNLGHGIAMPIEGLAREILRRTGSRSGIRHAPAREGEIRHSVAAVDRIRATGWSPASSLPEALASTVEWYRAEASRAVSRR
ncbi:MAG: NAD-dependent epimerase/dehydratase family protein [Verrucomicrobiales bacterium]|nr:NAD-dependent epimerase/dehydratase family protein [Verrucomicrobiales bacterium]